MSECVAGVSVAPTASHTDALHTVTLEHPADYAGWRLNARALLVQGIQPHHVLWQYASRAMGRRGEVADLFAAGDSTDTPPSRPTITPDATPDALRVPRGFPALAELVVCHSDSRRFAVLYRVLWRLVHGERGLLTQAGDDDVHRLHGWARAVRRDQHKMKAFVRFRPGWAHVAGCPVEPDVDHWYAWFEPQHAILRPVGGFFCRRFANMSWSLSTPGESAHWNGRELHFGPPLPPLPAGLDSAGAAEQLWRTYFRHTFNPARLRVNAMLAQMPVRYWKNLPESVLITELIHSSGRRTAAMVAEPAKPPPRYAAAARRQAALDR